MNQDKQGHLEETKREATWTSILPALSRGWAAYKKSHGFDPKLEEIERALFEAQPWLYAKYIGMGESNECRETPAMVYFGALEYLGVYIEPEGQREDLNCTCRECHPWPPTAKDMRGGEC